jgi:hypothetical protein
MIDGLAAGVAAFAAGATLRADVRGGATRWVPDSYDYAIRMLRLRGVPLLEAQERARAFIVAAPHTAGLVRFAAAFRGEPPWWRLFAPRVVYPALAALLYPGRGFFALSDVAAASHVASAVALYRFLRRFGDRRSALGLTVWYVRQPIVRDIAAIAMTDSTAMLLWILTLDMLCGLAAGRGGWKRATLLTAALSFTRPLPYLPLGGGVLTALNAARARDGAGMRTGAGIAAIAFGCAVAVMTVLVRAGVPSTPDHLRAVRAAQMNDPNEGAYDAMLAALGLADDPARSLGSWYVQSVLLSVATTLKHVVTAVVPVLALPGFVRARRSEVPLLIGTLAGGLAGCAADPSPRGTLRTVVLPLLPVFAAGCMLALAIRKRNGSNDTT